MQKTEPLLTIEETVMALTLKLGQPVAWVSFLADIRRPRDTPGPSLYGKQLWPACTQPGGGLSRPFYSLSDVKDFITAAKMANPSLKPKPFLTCSYERQPDDLQCETWRLIKAIPASPTPPKIMAPAIA